MPGNLEPTMTNKCLLVVGLMFDMPDIDRDRGDALICRGVTVDRTGCDCDCRAIR